METRESIGKWISNLYRQIQIYITKEFKQYHIGSGQFHVFMTLLRNDGIHQETISRSLNLDKANVTRAVNKLIEVGYVTKKVDPDDKRAFILYVTPKGRKIEPEIRKILENITSRLLSDFTKSEKKIALNLLKRMHQNMFTMEQNNNQ